ncbi:MAG: FAD-dependent thymidylate synthase [Candidatus Aenigmarchaeota archaeon]|nr:FAD-dependent thymidylate synthase [Candidatus Aenigmarchaeota archaeon]
MKVKLLRYTPNPEITCALAAQTSYSTKYYDERKEKMTLEKARKTLRKVIGYGHVSVIEHASFTFALEDVSRVLEIQLVRHRLASYTIKSGRYNKAHCDIVIPPKIAKNEKALKKLNEFVEQNTKIIQDLLDMGIPFEDVRMLSPQGIKTNIIVTMNARELLHFFNLRCCARAQWELRVVADEMLKQVKRVAPVIFEKAGPSCIALGYCPEGELKPETCNLIEIKMKFSSM